MKKKSRLLSAAIIMILLSVIATGTLAFFTDNVTSHNVITTSGVGIKVDEKTIEDGELVDFPEDGVDGVLPGMEIDKIVKIVAKEGTSEAWVRVKVVVEVKGKDGSTLPAEDVVIIEYLTDNGWTKQEDYWYYETAIKDGEATLPLFEKVVFADELSNEYQGATALVKVSAQAVQKANNGATALEAAGWPEE